MNKGKEGKITLPTTLKDNFKDLMINIDKFVTTTQSVKSPLSKRPILELQNATSEKCITKKIKEDTPVKEFTTPKTVVGSKIVTMNAPLEESPVHKLTDLFFLTPTKKRRLLHW